MTKLTYREILALIQHNEAELKTAEVYGEIEKAKRLEFRLEELYTAVAELPA